MHVRTNHNRAMGKPQPIVVRRNRASRAYSPGSLGRAEVHTAEDGAREGSVGAKVWHGTGVIPAADDARGGAGGAVLVSAALTDRGLASDSADGLKGGHRRGERIQRAVTINAVIAVRSAPTTVGAGRFRRCRQRCNARTRRCACCVNSRSYFDWKHRKARGWRFGRWSPLGARSSAGT